MSGMSDDPGEGPAPAGAALPPRPARQGHTGPDPAADSLWRPLFRLLSDMDGEIARLYAENGIPGLRPGWVPEIIRLHARGPMTIAGLARAAGCTHSAMSQKVAAMRAAGWLATSPGPDARSKKVTLTARAERGAGRLAAEWRATEATVREIEAEIPYPLSRAAADIRAALDRESFRDRIAGKLAADPAWSGR
jgi:DNA-binding MarR family transcriptional regulator